LQLADDLRDRLTAVADPVHAVRGIHQVKLLAGVAG
jgi:hypothetical protein